MTRAQRTALVSMLQKDSVAVFYRVKPQEIACRCYTARMVDGIEYGAKRLDPRTFWSLVDQRFLRLTHEHTLLINKNTATLTIRGMEIVALKGGE